MKVRPFNYNVVIEKDEKNCLESQSSLILINKPNEYAGIFSGTILFKDEKIDDLNIGDKIIFDLISCVNQFKLNGKLYFTLHYSEILAKIEND